MSQRLQGRTALVTGSPATSGALDILDPAVEYAGEALMHGTPAGRAGHPSAIAAAAVYLASDEAAFVHGTVLDVDGGRTAVAVVANAA